MARLEGRQDRLEGAVVGLRNEFEIRLPTLVTKEDVARLEAADSRLESSLAGLRTEIEFQLPTLAAKTDLMRVEAVQSNLKTQLDICLPTLATKVELRDKPSKTWMVAAVGVLVAVVAMGVALGALTGPVAERLLNS